MMGKQEIVPRMYLKRDIYELKHAMTKSDLNLIRSPAKPKKPRKHLESQIQQAIVKLVSYPARYGNINVRLSDYLFAPQNGGKRNLMEAVRLKREGGKAGVSDLFLTIPSKGYHGLWIEVKTATGKLTKEQKDWFAKQEEMGYQCAVVRSLEDFKSVVEQYLS